MTEALRTRLGPVTLETKRLRLEPLRRDHADALVDAAADEEIWDWMSRDLRTRKEMDRWIADALAAQERGDEYPFAVVLREGERVVGSTRFMDVQPAHRGVEIGWTWLSADLWGTWVNPEAKYLMLRHAFELWGAIRVCLKTDVHNTHSQAAIRKLGARYEGTLRAHRIRRDGSFRDSVVFSIVRDEWPGVKETLERRIGAHPRGAIS